MKTSIHTVHTAPGAGIKGAGARRGPGAFFGLPAPPTTPHRNAQRHNPVKTGKMGRAGIHPVLRKATVVLANGASVEIMTTVKKFRGIIKPQMDPTNHHLWTGKKKELENKGQIAKFNVRFEDMSTVKAKEAKEAAEQAAKADAKE